MLLKGIGTGFVLLAVVGRIFSKELELTQHKKQLAQLQLLLSVLKNEICLLRLPLPVVLEHCCEQVQAPFSELCRRMADALRAQNGAEAAALWRGLVAQLDALLLDAEERALLEEAGELLRMDNVAFKEQRFAVFSQRLEALIQTYEASLAQRRRINRYGTALAGVFVILLFL